MVRDLAPMKDAGRRVSDYLTTVTTWYQILSYAMPSGCRTGGRGRIRNPVPAVLVRLGDLVRQDAASPYGPG